MDRTLLALALSLMLAVPLSACTADEADRSPADASGHSAGSPTTHGVTHTTQTTDPGRGRYFADKKGNVRQDHTQGLDEDVRRVTDDVVDSARSMAHKAGRTLRDMT